jgi:hypothetical protein
VICLFLAGKDEWNIGICVFMKPTDRGRSEWYWQERDIFVTPIGWMPSPSLSKERLDLAAEIEKAESYSECGWDRAVAKVAAERFKLAAAAKAE